MINAGFPIFSMKATKSFLFVAGGGGNKDYGKKNGVFAIRKDTVSKDSDKFADVYETTDIILKLQVYTLNEKELEEKKEKIALKGMPIIQENSRSADSSLNNSFVFENENKSEEDETSYNKETNEKSVEGKSSTLIKKEYKVKEGEKEAALLKKEAKLKLKKNPIFIAAIGDERFYFLRFDGKFSLIAVLNKKIKQAYLNEHLFLLRNEVVTGFYNVCENPTPKLNLKTGKILENHIKDLAEEHVYRLYKKDEKVVILNDSCTEDIPATWHKFFVSGDQIYKIIYENGKNVFVFQNEKYKFEGQISDIMVQNQKITFYCNKETESNLYFIANSSKMYNIPKITAITEFENKTCVATCKGDVIIYINGNFSKKYELSSLPITGVDIDATHVYFSNLAGDIGVKKYIESTNYLLRALWIIMLLISIIIAVFKLFK
ncbi:hypothetical protein GINT2_001468 [Glugoides intestinalis]